MSVRQLIEIIITAAFVALCSYSHELLFNFICFLYFDDAELFHSQCIILHVETFEIVVGSSVWFGWDDSPLFFEFIPAWLPPAHPCQNRILLLQYTVMFLNIFSPSFIIFHKNFPQISNNLNFCPLRLFCLAEFSFKYLLYFLNKVCFRFDFSDDQICLPL